MFDEFFCMRFSNKILAVKSVLLPLELFKLLSTLKTYVDTRLSQKLFFLFSRCRPSSISSISASVYKAVLIVGSIKGASRRTKFHRQRTTDSAWLLFNCFKQSLLIHNWSPWSWFFFEADVAFLETSGAVSYHVFVDSSKIFLGLCPCAQSFFPQVTRNGSFFNIH